VIISQCFFSSRTVDAVRETQPLSLSDADVDASDVI